VGIPALVAWYLFKKKKNKFSQQTNIIIIAIVAVIFISSGIFSAYTNRAPILIITEPQNGVNTQDKAVTIRGKVNPASAKVTVNNNPMKVSSDGNFFYEFAIGIGQNNLSIVAINGGKNKTETLTINRTLTTEETAERERLNAEADAKRQAELEVQQKAQAEADAKAKAEQAAFDQTNAGKLCKQHASWTKKECQGVADRKYWIGMSYDMLVASYGSRPNHTNPSNYGGKTQWQWCWSDFTPSCFYDDNDDGIVDSYN